MSNATLRPTRSGPQRAAILLSTVLLAGAAITGLRLVAGSTAPPADLGAGQTASSLQQITPTLSLEAMPLNELADGPFDVDVKVTGADNLGAFEFDLVLDGTGTQLLGITAESFLGNDDGSCNPASERCAATVGPLAQVSGTGVGAYTFGSGGGATGDGVVATLQFTPTGQSGTMELGLDNVILTDVDAASQVFSTQGTSFEVGTRGNCNDDAGINAGDISAVILEIFDGDGSAAGDARGGSFDGSPLGCDADGDTNVDAGDVTCSILLIFLGSGACGP